MKVIFSKSSTLLLLCSFLFILLKCSPDENGSCTVGGNCDDNDTNTLNDQFDSNCDCIGTLVTAFDFGDEIQADVAGRILDEFGNDLHNVEVTVGNTTVLTDAFGTFFIKGVTIKDKVGYVMAQLSGFFDGSRTFNPTEGINVIEIRLLEKITVGSIASTSGGEISHEGVTVTFQPNSFTLNGSIYNGDVDVAINYIDPGSEDFLSEMPGTLLGIQNGNGSFLKSFGMVGIEITSESGDELMLADNSEAEIRFPIPSTLLSSAPNEIDLWSFDESSGLWLHEGKAIKDGDEYIAMVTHFSFWNCDIPTTFISLDGQIILNGQEVGIQGATITISSTIYGTTQGISGPNGYFGGFVPDNEVLTINVYLPCEAGIELLYSAQIGPFSDDIELDPINITPVGLSFISGTVINCDAVPIGDGYVRINGQFYFLDEGNYSAGICGANANIVAVHLYPNFESSPAINIPLNGDTIVIDTIEVCDGISIVGSLTDIAGNNYVTIEIGNDIWMAENLRTDQFANGEPIPQNNDLITWEDQYTAAWAYMNFDENMNLPYGKLYNQYAVVDPRGLCPDGWHIPSRDEWGTMIDYLGDNDVAGGKMKEAGFTHWNSPNTLATNESGFTALPAGILEVHTNTEITDPAFNYFGNRAFFWTKSHATGGSAHSVTLYNDRADAFQGWQNKRSGYSIRCKKD